jgi:short subunit dehydrogenase-like uncharacterized protein
MVLCPGVGFDVVPTDCVALKLKLAMRDATHLALGFESKTGLSKGTAKTSIEGAGAGGRVRRDGKLVQVPLAAATRTIDFGAGERLAVSIPWGDVATAFYTTGIPNIEVFSASSPRGVERLRRANRYLPLLRQRWVRALLKFGVQRRVQPPTQSQRDDNPSFIWGEARNAAGKVITARMRTANGYTLTVHASLAIPATRPRRCWSALISPPPCPARATFVWTQHDVSHGHANTCEYLNDALGAS